MDAFLQQFWAPKGLLILQDQLKPWDGCVFLKHYPWWKESSPTVVWSTGQPPKMVVLVSNLPPHRTKKCSVKPLAFAFSKPFGVQTRNKNALKIRNINHCKHDRVSDNTKKLNDKLEAKRKHSHPLGLGSCCGISEPFNAQNHRIHASIPFDGDGSPDWGQTGILQVSKQVNPHQTIPSHTRHFRLSNNSGTALFSSRVTFPPSTLAYSRHLR